MTITEFREEINRQIKEASDNYLRIRLECRQSASAEFWWNKFRTLQKIEALASCLEG